MNMENMAPIMFATLVVVMLIGFPVAFSLAAIGMGFGILSIQLGYFPEAFMSNLPLRIFGIMSNELLLAIPFFTFMGAILERCGLAEDLLEGTGQLFGGVPGGLGFAVILVGAILGAITGTVAASVIAMGVISLPIMMRYGYNMKYATGVIAASGTITQLIPPSLVLVVLADQLGRSVGDMYKGAIGPSLLQVALFLAYTAFLAVMYPKMMPPLPPEARSERGWKLWSKVLWGMVPSIVLIFLVLGTIFMGLATPTEAGALGAVGAVVLAALHRRLTWPLIWQAMDSTMRISAMVIFILIGSTVFSLVFQGVDGHKWVEHMLEGFPGGAVGFLIFVNLFVFFLAFFLDFFEIAFIIVPLLAPVADKMLQPLMPEGSPPEAALIWFGVMLCVNMQTSFMHPPFGFALFYLRGIADQIFKGKRIDRPILSKDIYLGSIPWIVMQLMLVTAVIFWPAAVTYWLDKEKKVDLDEASELLRGMGGGKERSADPPTLEAPPAPGAPPASPPSGDDTADAVKRALEQDANKK